jgi:asparagine synthase (glutamine-hydrolysing)
MVAAAVVVVSGLCVVATFDGTPVGPEHLEPMIATAAYRGRDGTGSWFDPGVGLTQQVLRATGDEPADPFVDGSLIVVADARLDNREELLAVLRDVDAACPDVGLIAAAYRRWGTRCAEHLIGDFAFVVWDAAARRLYAARDPLAMRSLAYHRTPRQVVLATEVKQVLAGPGVPRRIDEGHVAADLVYHLGFPHWSAYEGIDLLAPGHALEIRDGSCRTWAYWRPEPEHRIVHARREEYAEHLRELFVEAVAARIRTHDPVGVLLSGGVDSGAAASTAGWLIEQGATSAPSVHAATWAFDELSECDERTVAGLLVERYGFGWSQIPADHCGPLTDYPSHGPPLDEPFVGAFQALIDRSLHACRDAGARVVLGGDRGDLVIGWTGYRYLQFASERRWRDLRHELSEHRTGTGVPLTRLATEHLLVPGARRLPNRLRYERQRFVDRRHGRTGASAVPAWIRPEFSQRHDLTSLLATTPEAPAGFGPSRAERHAWIFTQLHIRGMAWSERSYAEHGLVFADPFSDRRIVEFALAVPQAAITPPGDTSKPLMRAAMRGIVPETARHRASKVVPRPLYDRSLTVDAVDTVGMLLTDMVTDRFGWIDARLLRAAHERSLHGEALPAPFWSALVTEWWARDHAA